MPPELSPGKLEEDWNHEYQWITFYRCRKKADWCFETRTTRPISSLTLNEYNGKLQYSNPQTFPDIYI